MEIERKWLILPEKIPYDLSSLEKHTIEQAYISFQPVVRIRRLDGGIKHILTVKRPTELKGLASLEDELDIDERTYAFLLSCASGSVIFKTRYINPLPSGLKEEIDIFSGEFSGLAYLEIEFPDAASASAYPTPVWAEADVTYDKRYKNASLARNGKPDSFDINSETD